MSRLVETQKGFFKKEGVIVFQDTQVPMSQSQNKLSSKQRDDHRMDNRVDNSIKEFYLFRKTTYVQIEGDSNSINLS